MISGMGLGWTGKKMRTTGEMPKAKLCIIFYRLNIDYYSLVEMFFCFVIFHNFVAFSQLLWPTKFLQHIPAKRSCIPHSVSQTDQNLHLKPSKCVFEVVTLSRTMLLSFLKRGLGLWLCCSGDIKLLSYELKKINLSSPSFHRIAKADL